MDRQKKMREDRGSSGEVHTVSCLRQPVDIAASQTAQPTGRNLSWYGKTING
jgi:hypothetical protein